MIAAIVAGAIAVIIGFGLGFPAGLTIGRQRKSIEAPNPKPICACGDSRGEHKDGTGRCNAQRKQQLPGYSWRWVPCPCMHYTGPVSVTEIWTPPLLPISKDGA